MTPLTKYTTRPMIHRLYHQDLDTSKVIRSVFQQSYAIEAKLLKAVDFPPLKRKLKGYVNCSNEFFGYFKDQQLAGVIEINDTDKFTHVQSLVVHPSFFRQGIGQELMQFTLKAFDAALFVVETGVDNIPAIELYKKLNFIEIKQWNTDHGVRKVKYEKRLKH